jgi:hypothetical protein
MHSCNSDVESRYPGLSRGVRDALADPIVQALLAADRVDPKEVADLARRMAARLFVASPTRAATAPEHGSGTDAFETVRERS